MCKDLSFKLTVIASVILACFMVVSIYLGMYAFACNLLHSH